MSYPQGYLYQPPGSLALYSCPAAAYGAAAAASALAAPRSDELARSSSGSAFSPYPGSAAFTAQAAATGFSSPLQYSADPAAAGFPSYMGSPYDAHPTGVSGAIGYHPYGSPAYPYQLNDPAYRKNATRDATATLKAWLQEHRKNPYPTKGEKIMLAIITKMTLTQVSTWFANARRRLKKENKMTWAPRNKSEDEDEDLEGDGGSLRAKEEAVASTAALEKVRDSNETSAEDEGISLQVDSLTDHSCSAPESDGEKAPCSRAGGDRLCEPGLERKGKYEEIDDEEDEEEEEEEDVDEEDEEEAAVGRGLAAKAVTSSPLTGLEAPLLGHPHGEESSRHATKAALDARIPPSVAAPGQSTQASKPKLWSLAEIATSDHKQHPPHPTHHHPAVGQSCPAPPPPPPSAPHNAAAYSPSSLLGRHIYYTSPFYTNYTNYGNFSALQGHQGILRYNSATAAAVASSEGLSQTVLGGGGGGGGSSGSAALKPGPETSLKSLASHLEQQHYKACSADSKKDPTEVCAVGVQPYL